MGRTIESSGKPPCMRKEQLESGCQIESIMLYHTMVLYIAGVSGIEAFQVFFCYYINQSVGRIVCHIIDIGDTSNHQQRLLLSLEDVCLTQWIQNSNPAW